MDKHLSSQFDTELNDICDQIMMMGGLVETQIDFALQALENGDLLMEEVRAKEQEINQLELAIDSECSQIIVRRQPTAKDLRLLMAISKSTANLERAADEAYKVCKLACKVFKNNQDIVINFSELKIAAQLAKRLVHNALDAFTRLDVVQATEIMKQDQAIDDEFRAFMRKLISYMMEDPKLISIGLDLLFIGKAIERLGDHAKNIAEFVIYVAKGVDLRHQKPDEQERQALQNHA